MRVALLTGCVQSVLGPRANDAAIRLLTRHGCEVVITGGTGCCGALPHHMGKAAEAKAWARRNIDAWTKEIERSGLGAIIVTASGCGTVMKDYGHMFRDDPAYAEKAARIAALVRDPVEVMAELGLQPPVVRRNPKVAYHAACSLQHGQKITTLPKELLAQAGFTVSNIPEGHMCCGSAGTYNILQPEIARQLQARKRANIVAVAPDVVAAGNIGCAMQIAGGDTNLTVVHTIELLDWATGGPKPPALTGFD
jgi:glycolate oxidase iron-sulfur subunit